jgi:serine/threonine-protein kinase
MSDETRSRFASLPLSLVYHINRICDDYEVACRAGQRPRIEDYVRSEAEPARAALLRELLAAELAARVRRGEAPTPQEYCDRFPSEAELIRAVFGEAAATPGPDAPAADRADRSWAAEDITLGGSSGDPAIRQALAATRLGRSGDRRRFRILRPHARGGLGEVFVAYDEELRREVALKEIRLDRADQPQGCERFLLEAEVTGGLEHPAIVPVYGLGRYDDGRPYYAMRLVRGESLKDAIARFHATDGPRRDAGARALALRRLLRRFVDACNAVAYAHSRGIIHRDVKPANILLGPFGETLVVDWGLAKNVARAGDAEDTPEEGPPRPGSGRVADLTQTGSTLGTPQYMSPEQAQGDLKRIGPRSDVFNLGATLYGLLTGRPPFQGDGALDVLRAAQAGEFPPPRRLDPTIDRALEAVCLKAMARAPEDRYGSAQALAEDVERWMADEPTSAWREPASRRLVRWLARHRTGVTAAVVATLFALAGTAAVLGVQTKAYADMTSANGKLRVANGELFASAKREHQRFELALEAIGTFHGEVSQDLLLKGKQFAGLRARLLGAAADFYGKLERLLVGRADPQSRAALGRAYYELGEITAQIGRSADALAVHRKGLAVRRELAGRPGADAEAVLDVVRSLNAVATLLGYSGDEAGYLESAGEALELAEGLAAAGRGSDEANFGLARCLLWSSIDVARRRPKEGLNRARRAATILSDLVAHHPAEARYQEELAWAQDNLGIILEENFHRPAEALAMAEAAAAIYSKLADVQPSAYRLQNALAVSHKNISVKLFHLGRHDEAIAAQRRAVATWRRAAEADPGSASLANNTALGLDGLAEYLAQTDPVEALAALAEARPILSRLAAADPGDVDYPSNLAINHLITGIALATLGRWGEMEREFEASEAIWRKLADGHPSDGRAQIGLADALCGSGWALWSAGRAADAAAAFGHERPVREALVAAEPTAPAPRDELARCETYAAAALLATGRTKEARACCDRAIALREELVRRDPADAGFAQGLAESLMRFGFARRAAGDPAGAAADWRRAEALYASHPPEGEGAIFRACCHGALAGLAGAGGSGVSADDGASHAERAMAVLRQACAGGYRDRALLRVEPGLDPLRGRADFQLLMMDLALPADPFAAAP